MGLDQEQFAESIEGETYLDELLKLRKEAHIKEIIGVPTFVYDNEEFVGAQSVSALKKSATS